MEGLLLNRSRLWLPAVSLPYRPNVRLVKFPAATFTIASFMLKSPATTPPEHIVPEELPTDLRDLLVIGSPRESTLGGWFHVVDPLIPLVHLTVMVSEPWPQEFQAENTSLIFSVELTMTMLGLRAVVLTW